MACSTITNQLEILTERLAELYFVKRDYIGLSGFLSDKISWIGTGINEICSNREEAMLFFAEESRIYDGYFLIEDSWFHGIEINDVSGIVMVTLTVKTPSDASCLIEMPLRFSIVWNKEKDLWKVIHVHNSIADGNLVENNYFNIDAAKSAYSQMNEKLSKAVNSDLLTGINNMNGFIHDTEQIFKQYPDYSYAIVKFGIKNFRYINRVHGYGVGDKVLQNIAKNLKKTCRDGEACARIEKDIFAMTYRFFTKDEMHYRMENRVRTNLIDKRIRKKINMDVCFIAGIYLPQDIQHEHVIDMLDKALIAQQAVPKNVTGSKFIYYHDSMMNSMIQKNELLEAAVPAMQNGEFQLYIQPQFDIQTHKIVSGEALCRWKKPNGSIIQPNDFIPVFEEYGMIISFDFHMLELLCRQMRKWMDEGLELKPVSINQSRLHIENEAYLEDFCSTVDRYGIPHEDIAFELTESAFVEQQDEMLKLASHLHKRGFQLAIDDFGTGYASLNFLSVVSADILKIDKCLLDGIENNKRSRSIIEKTIELAHEIDMTVICEGIETQEQLEYLSKIGCDIGQGYLIGRPMEAKQFETLWMQSNEQLTAHKVRGTESV